VIAANGFGNLPRYLVNVSQELKRRNVRYGSWLCKNAKTLNRDRRSYSSKTALVACLASEFNLEIELKNIIVVAFRFFSFYTARVKNGSVGAFRSLPLRPYKRTLRRLMPSSLVLIDIVEAIRTRQQSL
jgi:hypothetical protein